VRKKSAPSTIPPTRGISNRFRNALRELNQLVRKYQTTLSAVME
jgi:hypothetical protein